MVLHALSRGSKRREASILATLGATALRQVKRTSGQSVRAARTS
jgi:hypothetical protein